MAVGDTWYIQYIDDLFSVLNTSRIVHHISDVCINHVFYPDNLWKNLLTDARSKLDLCLIAPCEIAPQYFININLFNN